MGMDRNRPNADDDRPTTEDVLRALGGTSRAHVTELAETVGADPTVADRLCFHLQRRGYVRARGGGVYSLTALGERRLRRLGVAAP
jgi:DNA-binding IclR family transcriptional regulator